MSSYSPRPCSLSVLALLLISSFSAVPPTTGVIAGRVTRCYRGNPVPAAGVSVSVLGLTIRGSTSADGNFVLQNVPPGTYELAVSMPGYPRVVRNVDVESFGTTEVRIVFGANEACLRRLEGALREDFPDHVFVVPDAASDDDVLTLTGNDPNLYAALAAPDCIPPGDCVLAADGEWSPADCAQDVCPTVSIDTTVVVVSGSGSGGWVQNQVVAPPIDGSTQLVDQSNTLEFVIRPPLEEVSLGEVNVPWVAAFSIGDAMKLFVDITWSSDGDTPTKALEPNLLPVPLEVWRAPGVDVDEVEDDLLWAQVLFYVNRVGIEFTWTISEIVDEIAVGTDCANAHALKHGVPALHYTADAINVYYVDAAQTTDTSQNNMDGFDCFEQGAPEMIYIGKSRKNSTLAHELGHALGLLQPEYGHATNENGFSEFQSPTNVAQQANIMATYTPIRNRFTLGQVFRMNVDERAWLNRVRSDGTRIRSDDEPRLPCECSPLKGPCPPDSLDYPSLTGLVEEHDPPVCIVAIHEVVAGAIDEDPAQHLCVESGGSKDVVVKTFGMNEANAMIARPKNEVRWWPWDGGVVQVWELGESEDFTGVAEVDDWAIWRITALSLGEETLTAFSEGPSDAVHVTVATSCPPSD